jgi:putative tryptophan/tyrosine transport system substrate-binding protein
MVAPPTLAQQKPKLRRIVFFSGGSVASNAERLRAFREGLAALGWVEQRDYVIDGRYANGVAQALDGLAREVVAGGPDLVLTPADEVTVLLAKRTKTIPIVVAYSQDPVGNGYAASLRRPGGNVTGLTAQSRELSGKRVQLLKEAFPIVAHVALLADSTDAGSRAQVAEIQDAARRLKMRVSLIELHQLPDLDPAFRRATALGVQAYIDAGGFFSTSQIAAIVRYIRQTGMPAIYASDRSVDIGGLMSYGPSQRESFRRAAAYADKILKGAKPGELPIEQPVKIDLTINMKAAKAMGLAIPPTILLRADRVIE